MIVSREMAQKLQDAGITVASNHGAFAPTLNDVLLEIAAIYGQCDYVVKDGGEFEISLTADDWGRGVCIAAELGGMNDNPADAAARLLIRVKAEQ